MKVYTLTSVSNSLSMGYLAYLACVDSWCDISEKVIVTDGHSNDGTIEKIFEFVAKEKHKKIEIVKDDITFWSHDDFFNASQLSITWNHIIQNVDCDWLIVVNADYVFFDNGVDLKKELEQLEDELVVKFKRFKNKKDNIVYDDRGIILNIGKLKESVDQIGFCRTGKDRRMSDFPGIFKEKTQFRDINGCVKTIYSGEIISRNQKSIDLQCGVYGHFFFTLNQCLFKCRRWSHAISRSYGKVLESNRYLRMKHQLIQSNHNCSVDDLLKQKHPDSIKKIMLSVDMQNKMGAMSCRPKVYHRFLIILNRIYYKLINFYLRKRNFVSLEREYVWVPVESDFKQDDIIDLKEIYEKQNKFYK